MTVMVSDAGSQGLVPSSPECPQTGENWYSWGPGGGVEKEEQWAERTTSSVGLEARKYPVDRFRLQSRFRTTLISHVEAE